MRSEREVLAELADVAAVYKLSYVGNKIEDSDYSQYLFYKMQELSEELKSVIDLSKLPAMKANYKD